MKKQMSSSAMICVTWIGAGLVAGDAYGSALIPTGSYPIDPIYQSQIAGVGPLGIVAPGASLCGVTGNQVRTISVPGHAPSAPLFTMPAQVGGAGAFPGGFAVAAGGYILTGQTSTASAGPTFAGETYLTPAGGGPTTTHALNGVYDAAVFNGRFYASAAQGPDDHGNSTGVYGGSYGSGIYVLEQTASAITGVDLLFDTGTYSGSVATDPATGDLYFALGGASATLAGPHNGYNDIWVLKAANIAAAMGAGTINPALADYVGSVDPSTGISGMVFDPAGRLLVGLGTFGFGIDRIEQLNIDRSVPSDYTSTDAGAIVQATSSNVTILDFVLDGGVLRISAVPEPASALLLLVGFASAAWWRRHGYA